MISFKEFFKGDITRKVKVSALVSLVLPVLITLDKTMDWGIGGETLAVIANNLGVFADAAIALIISFISVFAAYSAKSAPADITSIPVREMTVADKKDTTAEMKKQPLEPPVQ